MLFVREDLGTKEGFFLGGTFMRGFRLLSPASATMDLIRFVEDFCEAFLLVLGVVYHHQKSS